ncbi:MAG: hypothetical protein JWQ49_1920 [Edaphobacter sp.]|nr:hypothetical protein [Edaphobacter sp.]
MYNTRKIETFKKRNSILGETPFAEKQDHSHFWRERRGSVAGILAASVWFHVTVVERAPTLREGGYAVDFRGAAMACWNVWKS